MIEKPTGCASPEFLRARTIDVSADSRDARAVIIRGILLATDAFRAVFLSQADSAREPALRQQLAVLAVPASLPSTDCSGSPCEGFGCDGPTCSSSSTRDGGPLAPSQFSSLLDLALGAPPMRPTADRCPSPRIDTSAGVGEPNLGCAAHPRRAAHARLRSLGAQRVQVSSSHHFAHQLG